MYELNAEEDMDISLISVGQGLQKNENIHEQVSNYIIFYYF